MKNTVPLAALLVFLTAGAFAQRPSDRHYRADNRRSEQRDDRVRSNRRTDVARLPTRDHRDAMRLNDLQHEARVRIGNGISNGTLTSREAIRLLNRYDRISAKERRYLSNRQLSRRETRELTRDLQQLIKGINNENRNNQRDRNRTTWRTPRRY